MVGKIIKVIGDKSIFTDFLGRYGFVKEKAYGDKWVVEFNARIGNIGSLSHIISKDDFIVIGTDFESL